MLLALRALQGFVVSSCATTSNAILADIFAPAERGRAMGVAAIPFLVRAAWRRPAFWPGAPRPRPRPALCGRRPECQLPTALLSAAAAPAAELFRHAACRVGGV